MVVKPYEDIIIDDYNKLRIFKNHIDDTELLWHRDTNDREIKIINGNNWKIQYDNEMPIILEHNHTYYIPKNTYHKLIKGNDDLIIHIIEDVA
jgi:hypothetical protein